MAKSLVQALIAALLTVPQLSARVTSHVGVSDEPSRLLVNLTYDESTMAVDRNVVETDRFSNPRQDLDIVLLLDQTRSMPFDYQKIRNELVSGFVHGLRGNDHVRVAAIADHFVLSEELSGSIDEKALEIDRAMAAVTSEPSPIWDCIYAAVMAYGTNGGKRIVLLVSDGRSNANLHSLDEVGKVALRARVSINVIGESSEGVFAQSSTTGAMVRPDAALKWLSQLTGGSYVGDGATRRTGRPNNAFVNYSEQVKKFPDQPGALLKAALDRIHAEYGVQVGMDHPDVNFQTLPVNARRPNPH